MKTIEYWAVEECYDRDVKLIGNFTNQEVAEEISGGKNKMYRSVRPRTLTLFDTIEDFENNTREQLRARGLAKLTTEEKLALGLK